MMDLDNWRKFTYEDFAELDSSNRLHSVVLENDNCLTLCIGSDPIYRREFKYTPDMPSYQELLKVVGPLTPGKEKWLFKPAPAEEIMAPHMLEEAIFLLGLYNRIDVPDESTIKIWSSTCRFKPEREQYTLCGDDYIRMIERRLGRKVTPGESIELPHLMPAEVLEQKFMDGAFNKLEMLADGSIEIWCSPLNKDENLGEHFNYPAGCYHISILEMHFGPMKPGDVFAIPEDELKNHKG